MCSHYFARAFVFFLTPSLTSVGICEENNHPNYGSAQAICGNCFFGGILASEDKTRADKYNCFRGVLLIHSCRYQRISDIYTLIFVLLVQWIRSNIW